MAAVCVRHSDVSGVWASLVGKCLFASVGGALACADCHRECHCHSVSPSLTVIENVTVTHCHSHRLELARLALCHLSCLAAS